MLMYGLVIFATIVAVISALLYKKFSRSIYLASKFPRPKGLPILGNGLLFFNKTAPEILETMHKTIKDWGQFVGLWLGPELCILISNPKDVEVLLSSQKLIHKSREYTFLSRWLGDGLLLSRGKKWFHRRKVITPTFHFKILDQFVEVFDRQSNVFIEQLQKYKPDDKFDVYPLVTLCALDVICESSMGTNAVNAQKNSDSQYVQAVKAISHIIHLRMFDFSMRYDLIFNWTNSARKERQALKILHDFTDKVIVARRDELMQKINTDENENEEDDIGSKKKMALLDVLLQSTIDGKPLTNMEIREEVDTFMFEGHDTTTSGISFALYLIGKYPDVQQRLVDEIFNVIGNDTTKPVTLKDLNELHYLDLVIKETMRMYPPVPLLGRRIHEETNLNGKIIPEGANVFVAVYFMGRDPTIHKDPNTFDPERFETETERNVEKNNPYSYVPFSAGPRNCIGQKFAILEMKSLISKVLRHYVIETVDKIDEEPILVAELILKPENGIIIKIKKRNVTK